jgi:hypothetical protein
MSNENMQLYRKIDTQQNNSVVLPLFERRFDEN